MVFGWKMQKIEKKMAKKAYESRQRDKSAHREEV
jgi:hypothetical protein